MDTPLAGIFSLEDTKALKAKNNFKDNPLIAVTALVLEQNLKKYRCLL